MKVHFYAKLIFSDSGFWCHNYVCDYLGGLQYFYRYDRLIVWTVWFNDCSKCFNLKFLNLINFPYFQKFKHFIMNHKFLFSVVDDAFYILWCPVYFTFVVEVRLLYIVNRNIICRISAWTLKNKEQADFWYRCLVWYADSPKKSKTPVPREITSGQGLWHQLC